MHKILNWKHPTANIHSWAVLQCSLMLLHVMLETYNWCFFLLWIVKLRNPCWSWWFQVFLVRKIRGLDRGQLYAMKVLKKATLKGNRLRFKHEPLDSESLFQLNHLHLVYQGNFWTHKKKSEKQAKEIHARFFYCCGITYFCSSSWMRGRTWLSEFSRWPTFRGGFDVNGVSLYFWCR